jgi:hypothetical protein
MITSSSFDKRFEFKGKAKTWSIALIAVGLTGILYGFLSGNGERTFSNLLLNAYYMVCICICGICINAISYVAKAGWSASILRIPQALGKVLPAAAVLLFLVICSGIYFTHPGQTGEGKQTVVPYLYKAWTLKGITIPGSANYNKIIAGKSGYLNITFFIIRLFLYLTVYSLIGRTLRKQSENEDLIGGMKNYKKSFNLSAAFLAIFMFTVPLFVFDVIMSLEPEWSSTLFAWYNVAGLLASGFVVVTLVAIYLRQAGYLEWFTVEHLHTLGVLIFGFSIFWTYLWFEQFLLQYYANLPEETVYFYKRWEPQYQFWFWLNMTINFLTPFLLFMSRDAKRKVKLVKVTCFILLFGHWLDKWQMIIPGTISPQGYWYNQIGIIEVCSFTCFAGIFIYALSFALSGFKALAPKNHPLLEESLHHQVA